MLLLPVSPRLLVPPCLVSCALHVPNVWGKAVWETMVSYLLQYLSLSYFLNLSVLPKVDSRSNLTSCTAEVIDGKIPGSQATSLSTDGNARKLTKTNRFVFSYQLK